MGVCVKVWGLENCNLDLDVVSTEKTVRTALEVKVEIYKVEKTGLSNMLSKRNWNVVCLFKLNKCKDHDV